MYPLVPLEVSHSLEIISELLHIVVVPHFYDLPSTPPHVSTFYLLRRAFSLVSCPLSTLPETGAVTFSSPHLSSCPFTDPVPFIHRSPLVRYKVGTRGVTRVSSYFLPFRRSGKVTTDGIISSFK